MPIDLEEQYDKIYRYCFLRVHNQEIAEDLTQETFLRFLEHPQYHTRGESLKYLYTIAKNLCIDEYRKKTPEVISDEFPEPDNTENKMITHIVLKQAVDSLSDEEKEMIMLRYINEVPVSVMSDMYNISRFALYRKIKSILSKLRCEFEKEN